MHIACFDFNHLGATAIVGGCVAMAVGSGIASRYLGDGRVTLCFAGDGAYNNGVVQEALNMACMAQFTNGLMDKRYGIPTIFIIVNNQYGMSGQQRGEVTGIDYLAERGFAYNKTGMHAEIVNGMDVLAVRDATLRATELARKGEGPILLEFVGYRFKGHSLSDKEYYRTREEVEAWMRWDPIKVYSERLLKEGILTEEELDRLVKEARLRNEEVAKRPPRHRTRILGKFARTRSARKSRRRFRRSLEIPRSLKSLNSLIGIQMLRSRTGRPCSKHSIKL